MNPVTLTHGEVYGKLTVLRRLGRKYRCGCECGTINVKASAKALMSGRVTACRRCAPR